MNAIQADFDRIARLSDDGWDHNSHYHRVLLRQLPARCGSALEIGCGTGAFARLLARRADHVIGLDLSPEMIRVAQERSAGHTNIAYQVADIMAWACPPDCFDCIVSIVTMHHLPMADILLKVRDALRPGGVLVILDLFKSDGWRDMAFAALAFPVSPVLALLMAGHLRQSPEVRSAWSDHGRHDRYSTLAQVRQACIGILPGVQIRRHLLWRYSLVWRKPAP